jgi:hypothetical protein
MNDAAAERCPRCGGSFHCGLADDAPCACTGIRLDAALQQRLRERYTGCLCLGCLQALAEQPEAAYGNGPPFIPLRPGG